MNNPEPSDLDLKLFLAEQLPEEITHTGFLDFQWKDGGLVTPREWDYIARRVEEKLTKDLQFSHNYGVTLALDVLSPETAYFKDADPDGDPDLNGFGFAKLAMTPWQTRARELQHILK